MPCPYSASRSAGVLGFHRVEHGRVAGPGYLLPQRRPERGVLGSGSRIESRKMHIRVSGWYYCW
jgi:hypothetical protein